MHQCSFWSNILCHTFGDHVGATRFVPFSADLQAGQIACSCTRFGFNLARHSPKLLSVLPFWLESKTPIPKPKLQASFLISSERLEHRKVLQCGHIAGNRTTSRYLA